MDSKAGLTEYNMDDTSIKHVMIRNAKEVVVVANSSKFQKVAFTFIGSFQSIQHFITDEAPPKALLTALTEYKVNIHVVGEDETRVL